MSRWRVERPLLPRHDVATASNRNESLAVTVVEAEPIDQQPDGILSGPVNHPPLIVADQALADACPFRQLLLGEVPSLDELVAECEAVTSDDVGRVVDRVMRDSARTLASVGPLRASDLQRN